MATNPMMLNQASDIAMASNMPAVQQPEELSPEVRRRLESEMEGIISRLGMLARDQVTRRQQIQERWLNDMRAYFGRYSISTEASLASGTKSRLFVKLTRQKVHGWEARINDMLFPTDDKNWGITPTPVPDLQGKALQAAEEAKALAARANEQIGEGNKEGAQASIAEGDRWADMAETLEREIDTARKCTAAMESEINDQLIECNYNVRCRDVIRDAVKLGTGIMKGPMVSHRKRQKWVKGPDGRWNYTMVDDPRPDMSRVDIFNFFPDMSARTIAETEFTFERWLPNRAVLKKLTQQMGFDKAAVAQLLEDGPREDLPDYFVRMREITGVEQSMESRYVVWEYHGSLEPQELATIALATGSEQIAEQMMEDPTAEIRVILFFCQNKLLKFGIHPLDSNESLYSAFVFEPDDACIFGFGVPHQMEDSQKALNGAWRMMMDNAGLSVGPQIVVDKSQLEPEDGSWELLPRKVWRRIASGVAGQSEPFAVHNIPNNQVELARIVELARQFADDETSMPLIAQGEQGAHITPTSGGMSMLMNNANVVFRRIVRQFDDQMTTPNIRRLYDWNMQFNPREDIKGDMEVDARGSSVLLVKEVQAQNLMQIVSNWSGHPIFGSMVKIAPLLRKTLQALMIPANEIIKDDATIKAEAAIMARQQQPPSPDEVRLQIATMENETRMTMAELQHETEMMKLAQQGNITLQQIQAQLEAIRLKEAGQERRLSGEIGAEAMKRQEERNNGETPKGSGGNI